MYINKVVRYASNKIFLFFIHLKLKNVIYYDIYNKINTSYKYCNSINNFKIRFNFKIISSHIIIDWSLLVYSPLRCSYNFYIPFCIINKIFPGNKHSRILQIPFYTYYCNLIHTFIRTIDFF